MRDYPEFRWAPEPPGPPYVATERVAALHAVISADDEPAVLVAHSAGCLTVAVRAGQYVGPVSAAVLVTPPFLDPDRTPIAGHAGDHAEFVQHGTDPLPVLIA